MNHKIYKSWKHYNFKTNINCGGCVAKVTPKLNEVKGIAKWNVDTNNPNKILTVEADNISANEVIDTVNKAGFKIEELN